jgi:hypothetical protein
MLTLGLGLSIQKTASELGSGGIPPGGDFNIITETGDPIITETGDNIVTEDAP